jgi:hypothetical protein
MVLNTNGNKRRIVNPPGRVGAVEDVEAIYPVAPVVGFKMA